MFGLYLHIPFCRQACVYCNFHFTTAHADRGSFIDALCTELNVYGERLDAPRLETIYFGGGTPSLLTPSELERLFSTIHRRYDASALCEVTLEMNPDDANLAYLEALRSLGVNRLSIGIQSLFAEDLRWMNRPHTAEEAERAVPLARKAGFEDFSVDLLFGLPEQPEEHWRANLAYVAAMDVPHVSTYGLTIEDATPLGEQVQRGLIHPASDDVMEARYRFAMDYLRASGYEQYELSSFARQGGPGRAPGDRRACHNRRHWRHEDYLGVGPSAHSFRWDQRSARRWSNVTNRRRYEALLDQHHRPLAEQEPLDPEALTDEYVAFRLRTSDGLDLEHLRTCYGYDLKAHRAGTIDRLTEEGFVEPFTDGCLRLTDRGKCAYDAVTAALLM